MNSQALLFSVGCALLAFVAIWLFQFWYARHLTQSILDEVLAETATPDGRPKLDPESQFIVRITEDQVTCTRPHGAVESVPWADLQKVEILTTDEGPFVPDQFWLLHGVTGGCAIPWGATGDSELLARLQRLPGFRNEAIINAASLTTGSVLVCWERPAG